MRPWVAVLCLTGCDFIFTLDDPAQPIPGDGQPIPGDGRPGGGLLNPPPSSDVCTTPPPSFESFQYTPTVFPYNGPPPLGLFSFYKTAGKVRAIATNGDQMFDVAEDGTATHLAELDPPEFGTMTTPRVTYDGVAMWFAQSGVAQGVYVATAASGWMRQRADLGFVNAEAIEPGAIGYFANAARMVVSVRLVSGSVTLHELTSVDGEHWTELDTIRFAPTGLGDRSPALSPDGCYLLYTGSNGTNEVRISLRDASGNFTTATRIDKISMATTAASFPVLTPDQDALWFTAIVGPSVERYRGEP